MSSLKAAHFAHEIVEVNFLDLIFRNIVVIVSFARVFNNFNLPLLNIDLFFLEVLVASGLLLRGNVLVSAFNKTNAGFFLCLLILDAILVSALRIGTEGVFREKLTPGIVLEVVADVLKAKD